MEVMHRWKGEPQSDLREPGHRKVLEAKEPRVVPLGAVCCASNSPATCACLAHWPGISLACSQGFLICSSVARHRLHLAKIASTAALRCRGCVPSNSHVAPFSSSAKLYRQQLCQCLLFSQLDKTS